MEARRTRQLRARVRKIAGAESESVSAAEALWRLVTTKQPLQQAPG